MNINEMKKFSQTFLKTTYGIDMEIPLTINNRLKTTCGRFRYKINRRTGATSPLAVEMNGFFVKNNTKDVVVDVLKHELVHYALFTLGKPHSDGHPVFERELKRLGVVSQSTIDQYTIKSKPRNVNVYKCVDNGCGKEYQTLRALSNNGIYHRCKCGCKIQHLGKKLIHQ